MKSSRNGHVLRQLPYLVVSAALMMIAGLAVQQTLQLRQDFAENNAQEAAQVLRQNLTIWEQSALRQVNARIDELESAPDIAAVERMMRRSAPWLDAIYIWEPDPRSPRLRYPARATVEDPVRLVQHPCVLRAVQILRFRGRAEGAEAYRACREAPPRYNLYTSSLAAALLLQQGQPHEAWLALNEISTPLMLPLREAGTQGLPLHRIVSRRIQGAQAQASMGQPGRQRELLMSTARELADLDARQLDELSSFLQYTIPRELQKAGAPNAMAELRPELARAERRIEAYKEISQRLIARPAPEGDELQITRDPYDEEGFLLAYRAIFEGQLVVAVQIDPVRLLDELPDTGDRIIVDLDGYPIDGIPLAQDAVWVKVPFGKLFPTLQLARLRPDEHMEEQYTWLISQLAPVALALLLGGLALAARLRADRRREELYERQRDFITRVTHELKTPLAGIRIMAETLEMIGAEAPEETATFTGRILQEADRLTERIDEVLRLTRQPVPPRKAPLSPALLADELWDEWAPRFVEAGGSLELDVDLEMDDIRADEALLRDALVNLLSNALKYRHPERPLQATLRAHRERRHAVFEVIDNGLGVPKPMREAIFERFTRVEGDHRGKAGGHGLGLSFVAETARAHGGTIRCTGAPDGQGTRFTLRIPYR